MESRTVDLLSFSILYGAPTLRVFSGAPPTGIILNAFTIKLTPRVVVLTPKISTTVFNLQK